VQVNNPTNPNAGVASSPFNETRYIGRLSSLALSHLSKCQHLRKFQAEDLLFNQGDHLDCLFVILDGVVGFTVDFGLDRHSWLYVAGPGSIVDLGISLP